MALCPARRYLCSDLHPVVSILHRKINLLFSYPTLARREAVLERGLGADTRTQSWQCTVGMRSEYLPQGITGLCLTTYSLCYARSILGFCTQRALHVIGYGKQFWNIEALHLLSGRLSQHSASEMKDKPVSRKTGDMAKSTSTHLRISDFLH